MAIPISYEHTKTLADMVDKHDCGDVKAALLAVINGGLLPSEVDVITRVCFNTAAISGRRGKKK